MKTHELGRNSSQGICSYTESASTPRPGTVLPSLLSCRKPPPRPDCAPRAPGLRSLSLAQRPLRSLTAPPLPQPRSAPPPLPHGPLRSLTAPAAPSQPPPFPQRPRRSLSPRSAPSPFPHCPRRSLSAPSAPSALAQRPLRSRRSLTAAEPPQPPRHGRPPGQRTAPARVLLSPRCHHMPSPEVIPCCPLVSSRGVLVVSSCAVPLVPTSAVPSRVFL